MVSKPLHEAVRLCFPVSVYEGPLISCTPLPRANKKNCLLLLVSNHGQLARFLPILTELFGIINCHYSAFVLKLKKYKTKNMLREQSIYETHENTKENSL